MTPPSAPPAISPEAMMTPRSRMRLPGSPPVFSERLFRKWDRNPPTSAGVLSSSGKYMPRAKMSEGWPSISRISVIMAPTPKSR